jgi:pyruvate/2-oxoglutarate dehydrogenase complex dihydrolipoamide acyltransferase (E2) component
MAEQLTKREAVSRGMAHFGNDVPLAQMREWIKKEMGIEMTDKHISTARGDILRKEGVKKAKPKVAAKKAAPKAAAKKTAPKPQTAPTPQAGPKPVAASAKSSGIPLGDILYVKELVGRVGPEQLHTLIDALVK